MATDNQRTKMVHIYTPHTGNYRFEIEREVVRTYENGDALQVPGLERLVHRQLADLAAQNVPGGPVTVTTYGDLAELIRTCAAALAAEDEAAEAPAP